MDAQAHWQQVYGTKRESEVSWYQREPTVSLDLIRSTLRDPNAGRVIDVGGGASLLVDRLLDLGVGHVAVLDVSDAALDKARTRLGVRAASARWIVGDVTRVADVGQFDVDQVAEQALRVVGDADGDLAIAFDARPLVGFEEFQIAGNIAHRGLRKCRQGRQG